MIWRTALGGKGPNIQSVGYNDNIIKSQFRIVPIADSGLCHRCVSLDDSFGGVSAEDDAEAAEVDAEVDVENNADVDVENDEDVDSEEDLEGDVGGDADVDTVEDADAVVPC
eukprot:gene5814-11115_t